jgi:hypothetical protein
MTRHLPPDPPLDIAFLSAFVAKGRWMRKYGDWKEKLLYRLAKAYLDVLTQQAIASDVAGPEEKWTSKVRR